MIALATHRAVPEATADDRRLVAPLARRSGARVEDVAWNEDHVAWEGFDAVLIRSTWDYHHDPAPFIAWAMDVQAGGVEVWNPPDVVRWNADKRYLRELERAGVPVVPTEWIPRGSVVDLSALLRRNGWSRAVVKPSVAATAFRTWVTAPGTAAENTGAPGSDELLATVLAEADALVQPFLEPVVREGEWSFVYFDDGAGGLAFSHAVVKRPAHGDFRVQEQFGGSAAPATPPASLRSQVDETASVVGRLAPGPLLYARLDGVVGDGSHAPPGTFLLMEAELIEPVLFLGSDGPAADRFAAAVARRLERVREAG